MEDWQPRLTLEGTCELLGVTFDGVERTWLLEKMKELEGKQITEMWRDHGNDGLLFYRVATLKEKLGSMGLRKNGRKHDLVERLDQAFANPEFFSKRKRVTKEQKENDSNIKVDQRKGEKRSRVSEDNESTVYYTFDVHLKQGCSKTLSAAFDDLTFDEFVEVVFELFGFPPHSRYAATLPGGRVIVSGVEPGIGGVAFHELEHAHLCGGRVNLGEIGLMLTDVISVSCDVATHIYEFTMTFKERMRNYKRDAGLVMLLST